MKLVVDTNIVLDILLSRKPFKEDAKILFSKIDSGELEGGLVATTITTIHYFLDKFLSRNEAIKHLNVLCDMFEILPVNRNVIERALTAGFTAFEDAIIHEAAYLSGSQAIITRNQKDFKNATIRVYSLEEFLKIF